jgi:nitroreductase
MITPMAGISSHIALTTMELAAKAFGLGTCWAGFVMVAAMSGYEPLLKLLHLEEDHQICGAMILGYPQLEYRKIPIRNKPTIYWND